MVYQADILVREEEYCGARKLPRPEELDFSPEGD